MKVYEKNMITEKFKMVTAMEDYINGFERIWLYAGNDKGSRYSIR